MGDPADSGTSEMPSAYRYLSRFGPWLLLGLGTLLVVCGVFADAEAEVRIAFVALGAGAVALAAFSPRMSGDWGLNKDGATAQVMSVLEVDPVRPAVPMPEVRAAAGPVSSAANTGGKQMKVSGATGVPKFPVAVGPVFEAGFASKTLDGVALIDTGAERTCVDSTLVHALGLQPTGYASVILAAGTEKPVYEYPVSLHFASGAVRELVALALDLPQGTDVLIGRDVLRTGHLEIGGDNFSLTFE